MSITRNVVVLYPLQHPLPALMTLSVFVRPATNVVGSRRDLGAVSALHPLPASSPRCTLSRRRRHPTRTWRRPHTHALPPSSGIPTPVLCVVLQIAAATDAVAGECDCVMLQLGSGGMLGAQCRGTRGLSLVQGSGGGKFSAGVKPRESGR